MKRWKKLLLVAGSSVFLLLLVTVFAIDFIAKTAVEKGAKMALGVETSLRSMHVALFSGECSMGGLLVQNPPRFETPHFLSLEKGGIAVTLGSLMGNKVVIPRLELQGIDLNLEKTSAGANFDFLFETMKQGESAPEETKAAGKKFVIEELSVKDVKVHGLIAYSGLPQGKVELQIPEIHLSNVGSDSASGISLSELSAKIVQAILSAALEQGSGKLPGEFLHSLKNRLGSLKSIGNLKVEKIQDLQENVKDLKDLLKNKGKKN